MRSSPWMPFSLIALIAALTLLLSGWTCSGMFVSCQGISQAQITSLSPGTIPRDVNSVPLTVDSSDRLRCYAPATSHCPAKCGTDSPNS